MMSFHLHQGHRQRKAGTCWRCLNLKQFGARVGHTACQFDLEVFLIFGRKSKSKNIEYSVVEHHIRTVIDSMIEHFVMLSISIDHGIGIGIEEYCRNSDKYMVDRAEAAMYIERYKFRIGFQVLICNSIANSAVDSRVAMKWRLSDQNNAN